MKKFQAAATNESRGTFLARSEKAVAAAALGVRHITTFATYIDAFYSKLHGDSQPALDEYGAAFKQP